jgi:trigger factor
MMTEDTSGQNQQPESIEEAQEAMQAASEALDTPQEAEGDNLPENQVVVEDSGTLKKKITVTVFEDRIKAKSDEMYGELSESAQIPGFRIGRAPRRLIEKRFGKEIAGDVKNALVGEALGQAIEEAELTTLGEPDIELDSIELPAQGDMEFSFEVEVQPEFDLPELEGIPVNKVVPEVSDERMEEFLTQVRESRASFEETEEPAQKGDVVQASAIISAEGIDAVEHPGLTLRVAAGQIEGLPIVDLGEVLAGKKAGDSAETTVTCPESHPNEEWHGKEMHVKINISSVRHRELPELNDELAQAMGFDSLEEMKEYMSGQLQGRMQSESEQSMRDQVCDWLLEQVDIDVPEGVAQRHTARTLQRQYVSLMRQGVPRERIDENMAELQASATEQARRDLKLQFILGKVIEQQGIMVGEDELNTRIAQMAMQYNRRPERLKQEMESDGSLEQVRASLAEEAALNNLLEKAEVTEMTPEEAQARSEAENETSEDENESKE